MKINDLCYNATGARYGYNSQEQSTELNLDGNHTTAEFWEYDARSTRRWNLDPVDQISKSNYATFANNPITFNDLRGDNAAVSEHIDDEGVKNINISSNVYITGPGAGKKLAEKLDKEVNNILKSEIVKDKEGSIYKINLSVKFIYEPDPSKITLGETNNMMTFEEGEGVSHTGDITSTIINAFMMTNIYTLDQYGYEVAFWQTKTPQTATIYNVKKLANVVAHELLHLFGLSDRYADNGLNGKERRTYPLTGFNIDIMGSGVAKKSCVHYQNFLNYILRGTEQNKITNFIDLNPYIDPDNKSESRFIKCN